MRSPNLGTLAALTARQWRRWIARLRTDVPRRRTLLMRLGWTAVIFSWVAWTVRPSRTTAVTGVSDPIRIASGLVATLLGFNLVGGVSGFGLRLPRPGLTTMLVAPLRPRLLLGWAMLRLLPTTAWGLAVFGLMACFFAVPRSEIAGRLPGVAALVVLGAVLLSGFSALVSVLGHRLPARTLGSAVLTMTLLSLGLGTATAFELFAPPGTLARLPAPVGPPLAAIQAGLLDGAEALVGVVGAAITADRPGLIHVHASALALACVALALVLAPLCRTERVFEASVRIAEAARQGRRTTTPGRRRRAGWPRPFGTGAVAMAWKSLAEAWARTPLLLRPIVPVLPVVGGVLTAWLCAENMAGTTPPPELLLFPPLLLVGGAAGLGSVFGGRGGAGLGTEIEHRTWLLRAPVGQRPLLAALVGVPWLQGCAFTLLAGAPLAIWVPEMRAITAVAFASAAAMLAAVRLARAVLWLAWPPGPGPQPLSDVLHALITFIPFLLGIVVGVMVAGLLRAPPAIAVMAAGLPSVVGAGGLWLAALRQLRRLELA